MNWKIPLFKIYWDNDDIESVSKVIRRGSYWATGPEINSLEKELANYVSAKFAVSFNSGTSALHASLLAHNITSAEVIVPSFTFISTANSVVLAGAKPIFADIEEDSYGLNADDVNEKITKDTKAIMPIHYGGAPCKDIKILREIAEDKNIVLIEDAAESLGSKMKEKMVGTFGHSSMFSFCQNKIITSGEGGMIVTNLKDVFEKLKLIRSHGRVENRERYFSSTQELDYIQAGYNYRMSSITAALALSQLKKIDKIIQMRREKAKYFNEKLSKIKNLKLPTGVKDHFHVYQLYTILSQDNKLREILRTNLSKAGIMTRIYFSPAHLKTFYKTDFNYKKGDLPKTEEISEKVLTIPLYPMLSNKEMDYIINEIENCCE